MDSQTINQSAELLLEAVKKRIEIAAQACGRNAADIKLIAVSKNKTSADIREFYKIGIRDFAENYVQEFISKKEELSDLTDICWHFIGHLQSNKCKLILDEIDLLHSLDRPTLAELLVRSRAKIGILAPMKILMQLEVDPTDPNKFGATPKEAPGLCRYLVSVKELQWAGFMGMGPAGKTADELKPLYDAFRLRCDSLWQQFSPNPTMAPEISLGMSGDLETAIAAGSTMVRIGSALFGAR